MQKTLVKICCISSVEEAKLALSYGASALGLVGHMPSGPGVISDQQILAFTTSLPTMVSTFLLTSETQLKARCKQIEDVFSTHYINQNQNE